MAKFSVYFKDKLVSSVVHDTGVLRIGRDDSNDLVVDSLAVAPVHAVVLAQDNQYRIKPLDDRFPLLINGQALKEYLLQDNDVIDVGKHYIVFNTLETLLTSPNVAPKSLFGNKRRIDQDVIALNEKIDEQIKLPVAKLQVAGGAHIGRVLPLKKSITRLGQEGASIVVITHRKEGFFISALQGAEGVHINQQPLGDATLQLNNEDVITLDNVPMQFFQD